jgi:hypothetical protein
MEKANIDDLYREFAGRFKALGQFFDKLGSEEAVQELLDCLISGDSNTFNRLIETVDIPDLPPRLKCVVYREVIDKVICDPHEVEVCRLRLDLTAEERLQYLQIAFRYRHLQPTPADTGLGLTVLGENPEIPPGPFLDELKTNNLVTCKLEVRYDCKIGQVLGLPEWICI